MKKSLRIVRRQRLARERLHLLPIRRRPVGHGRTEAGQSGIIKRQRNGAVQANAVEKKRQLRVIAKALTGKNADLLSQQLAADCRPASQIPQLGFQRQQWVFALDVGTAADVRLVVLKALTNGGQDFRMIPAKLGKQLAGSDQ